ncbi:MAG TPA: translation initiation factor IF-3 [Armatimonadetes bacterium]|nr:translation initiation factor IF-3 [Armatimonadota bacterium]
MPEKRLRRNEEIRVPKVRLVDENGQQVGVVWVREALEAARDAGLDLLEVAPDANPPVCRIMDWGKYRYEQKQREREQRKKQRSADVKQLRLRPMTGKADFEVTRRRADAFLRDGHKVRVEVRFRGREITHQDLGRDVLLRLAEAVGEIAEIETRPSMEGRRMFVLLAPTADTLKALAQREREAEEAGTELVSLSSQLEEDIGADDDDDDRDDVVTEAEPEVEDESAAADPPSGQATEDTA